MKFSSSSTRDRIALIREEAEKRSAARRASAEGHPRLEDNTVDRKALFIVPEERAREARLAVVGEEGGTLTVAVYSSTFPKTIATLRDLQEKGYNVVLAIATMSELEHIWHEYRSPDDSALSQAGRQEESSVITEVALSQKRIDELKRTVRKVSSVKEVIASLGESPQTSDFVATLLGSALVLRASDIHLERKTNREAALRYRVDGVLRDITVISERAADLLIHRVKLLAGLKLNVHDAPQDGRFTIKSALGDVEVRASVVPAEYGEAVVLRVLDPRSVALDIEALGFRADDVAIVLRELKRPNGIILATGPTGSGKTTTLYAFLKRKRTPELKIITIEDPIEYHVEGIEQTQVNPESGYTFASGLRSILRQDPDIILVGEIRDLDTAETAIHAALTGHLVFSTLHTNSAAGAIPRLIDLGVEANVMGTAIVFVIAQRLVRLLCPACREEIVLDSEMRQKIDRFLKRLPKRVSREGIVPRLYRPGGCEECEDGYKGRTAIAEVLELGDEVRALVQKGVSEQDIEKVAVDKQGMVRIQEDGILKSLAGVTTLEEVERETGQIAW